MGAREQRTARGGRRARYIDNRREDATRVPHALHREPDVTAAALGLYSAIDYVAATDEWADRATVMRAAGVRSERVYYRARRWLEDRGYLRVTPSRGHWPSTVELTTPATAAAGAVDNRWVSDAVPVSISTGSQCQSTQEAAAYVHRQETHSRVLEGVPPSPPVGGQPASATAAPQAGPQGEGKPERHPGAREVMSAIGRRLERGPVEHAANWRSRTRQNRRAKEALSDELGQLLEAGCAPATIVEQLLARDLTGADVVAAVLRGRCADVLVGHRRRAAAADVRRRAAEQEAAAAAAAADRDRRHARLEQLADQLVARLPAAARAELEDQARAEVAAGAVTGARARARMIRELVRAHALEAIPGPVLWRVAGDPEPPRVNGRAASARRAEGA
jgi:hypothetical protein